MVKSTYFQGNAKAIMALVVGYISNSTQPLIL